MMQVMTVSTQIQNSTLRELRTALQAFNQAEYTGGRERAAQFLASVASDLLTGIGSIEGRAEPKTVMTTGGTGAEFVYNNDGAAVASR